MAEAHERGRVLGPQAYGAVERLPGLGRAAVVGEGIAELAPAVGVVRIERDGALEVLDRLVLPELHRRPAGQPEQRRIERVRPERVLDRVPCLAVLARCKARPRLIGEVVIRPFSHRLEPSRREASISRSPPQIQHAAPTCPTALADRDYGLRHLPTSARRDTDE